MSYIMGMYSDSCIRWDSTALTKQLNTHVTHLRYGSLQSFMCFSLVHASMLCCLFRSIPLSTVLFRQHPLPPSTKNINMSYRSPSAFVDIVKWSYFQGQLLSIYPTKLVWAWSAKPKHPILDTRISVRPSPSVTLMGPPPLDSETGGLESSGRRLISSIGKTN